MSSTTSSRRPNVGHGAAFWLIALTFLTMMAFATVPTPLYALYQARDGFETFTVTVIFSAYAVGVILALTLAGHVSDWMGRRRIMLIAASVQVVSAVLFLTLDSVAGLIVARFVSGLAVGMLTATATAALAELRHGATGATGIAPMVATAVNLGGLALGPVVGGLIAQFSSAPLVLPYAIFLAALGALLIAMFFVPETVPEHRQHLRYRVQRISVPAHSRADYWMAGAAAFGAFAVTGFYGSVAPTFLAREVGVRGPLVVGLVAASVFGAAAVAQLVFRALGLRRKILVGVLSMLVGMALLALSGPLGSLFLFVAAGVLGGLGMGLIFAGAIGVSASLAGDENRGEVLAGTFLMAYAGMTVPPVVVGVALLSAPLVPVLVVFAAFIFVLVAWSGFGLLRRLPVPVDGKRRRVTVADATEPAKAVETAAAR